VIEKGEILFILANGRAIIRNERSYGEDLHQPVKHPAAGGWRFKGKVQDL